MDERKMTYYQGGMMITIILNRKKDNFFIRKKDNSLIGKKNNFLVRKKDNFLVRKDQREGKRYINKHRKDRRTDSIINNIHCSMTFSTSEAVRLWLCLGCGFNTDLPAPRKGPELGAKIYDSSRPPFFDPYSSTTHNICNFVLY